MARTLSQVVGVERGLRRRDNDFGKDLKNRVQVPQLVTGSTKVFTADDEAEAGQYGMDEYQEVALTVADALAQAAKYAIPAIDSVATKDTTNQVANADLTYGGKAFKNVPVSHLLWLEDWLAEWRTFIAVLPTLNPSLKWSEVEGHAGLHESRPEKVLRHLPEEVPVVLYPHTDKHVAQTQLVKKAVYVGYFTKTVLSGAITPDRKSKLLDNVDGLIAAVKDAISRANHTQAVEVEEGQAIMDLLLA